MRRSSTDRKAFSGSAAVHPDIIDVSLLPGDGGGGVGHGVLYLIVHARGCVCDRLQNECLDQWTVWLLAAGPDTVTSATRLTCSRVVPVRRAGKQMSDNCRRRRLHEWVGVY